MMNDLTQLMLKTYQVFKTAIREFLHLRALEAGAGVAYYAFFSLFPLIIFLISALGLVLSEAQVKAEVFKLLEEFFPVYKDDVVGLIESNLQMVARRRSSATLIAAIGLLWAGSNAFTVLVRNINRPWHTTAKPFNLLQSRLVAFAIIFSLSGFILVSFMTAPVMNLLAHFDVGGIAIQHTFIWDILNDLLPHSLSFLVFLALYRWVPNTRVPWSAAAGGALVATLAWYGAVFGFKWAIKEGVVNYQLIYGSLATVVLTLIWIYASSLILLFGAHLSAAIAQHKMKGRVNSRAQ